MDRRYDLVAIVQRYGVTLRGSGKCLQAKCPLPGHDDSGPSFTVWPEVEGWKCYGCGRHGNAVQFVQAMEGLSSYREAERRTCQLLGLPLPSEAPDPDLPRRELLTELANEWHRQLLDPSNRAALDYLTDTRQIGMDAIRAYRIGWCPRHFPLADWLRTHNLPIELARQIGLLTKTDQSFFFGRIILPNWDGRRGQVIDLQGRAWPDGQPKYLCMAQTRFRLWNASVVRAGQHVWLCEGIPDALQVLQLGEPAVGLYGNSRISEAHAALLRPARAVYIALDPQDQGAAESALELAMLIGTHAHIVEVPVVPVQQGKPDLSDYLTSLSPADRLPSLVRLREFAKPALSMLCRDIGPGSTPQEIEAVLVRLLGSGPTPLTLAWVEKELQRRTKLPARAIRITVQMAKDSRSSPRTPHTSDDAAESPEQETMDVPIVQPGVDVITLGGSTRMVYTVPRVRMVEIEGKFGPRLEMVREHLVIASGGQCHRFVDQGNMFKQLGFACARPSEQIILNDRTTWRDGVQAYLSGARRPTAVELHDAITVGILLHVVLPAPEYDPEIWYHTLACWVMMTYVFPFWPATPYLNIYGVASSGKSRLMEVMERMVHNPFCGTSASEASLYRSIAGGRCTVLLDECDKLSDTKRYADVLGVLQTGYRVGGQVPRINADTLQLEVLPTYSPKAFCSIYGVPGVLATRCIELIMQASADQSKTSRRLGDYAGWDEVRECCYHWGVEAIPDLARAREHVDSQIGRMKGLPGRQAELWTPLMTIACTISDALFERMLAHAIHMQESAESTPLIVRLALQGIAALRQQRPWFRSSDLAEWMTHSDQWEYDEPCGVKRAANVLRSLGIRPSHTRTGAAYEPSPEMIAGIAAARGIKLEGLDAAAPHESSLFEEPEEAQA